MALAAPTWGDLNVFDAGPQGGATWDSILGSSAPSASSKPVFSSASGGFIDPAATPSAGSWDALAPMGGTSGSRGTWDTINQQFDQWYNQQYGQRLGSTFGGVPTTGGTSGSVTTAGGGFAMADHFNGDIAAAAAKNGMPANLLKSILVNESQGDWGSNAGSRSPFGEEILPFSGIKRATADYWGLNYDAMANDPSAQIQGMAYIFSHLAQQYGGWENAVKVWYMGPGALNSDLADPRGMPTSQYYNQAIQQWQYLDSLAPTGTGGSPVAPVNGQWGGNPTGNSIVQVATSFVGQIPYVWGAIPGKGETPTGWDCSGFTYWLDQNYGSGSLPMGSHFQYQWGLDRGLIFNDNTQLQPGDLVFFDTGVRGGGGSELNGASHVGMYIGNGQFVQAANESVGTVISNLADYQRMYPYLGAMHMGWSGGAGGPIPNGPSSGYSDPYAGYSDIMRFMAGGSPSTTTATPAGWGSTIMDFMGGRR